MLPTVFKIQHGQQFFQICPVRLLVVQQHREQDVLFYGQFRDEVECLKDKTDIAAAEDRQLPVFHGKNILAINQHLAGSRRIQSTNQVEQGAFAGAGFANDRHIFAFRH